MNNLGIGIATFVAPAKGFRGNQSALYKLSTIFEDYEYVVLCSICDRVSCWEGETAVYGANEAGVTADEEIGIVKYQSHTDTLYSMGFKLILFSSNEPYVIDKWDINKRGYYLQYTSRDSRDAWYCACKPFELRKTCSHITKKKEHLTKLGIETLAVEEQASEKRVIRLDD